MVREAARMKGRLEVIPRDTACFSTAKKKTLERVIFSLMARLMGKSSNALGRRMKSSRLAEQASPFVGSQVVPPNVRKEAFSEEGAPTLAPTWAIAVPRNLIYIDG